MKQPENKYEPHLRQDIGWAYGDLKIISEEAARKERAEIRKTINQLSKKCNVSFHNSKLHKGSLSKGCITCGKGQWSCIFFSRKCPANCFYCPQEMSSERWAPSTEGLTFSNARDYIDYLKMFDFTGVGFSGGDPLVHFGKLIPFIKSIRRAFGDELYLWIYTNGMLLNDAKLKKLHSVGLDEIRVDIAAINYGLEPVKRALKYIDTVSVEIPAIPEDQQRVIKCISRMEELGVSHLNLHELNASEFNYRKLVDHGYTFVHRPHLAVLESEKTALAIIEYCLKSRIQLPINYCTSEYKYKMQGSAIRRRAGSLVVQEYEETTESGYLRSIFIHDVHDNLKRLVGRLRRKRVNNKLWYWDKEENRLFVHYSIIEQLKLPPDRKCIFILHADCNLADSAGDDCEYIEVPFNSRRNIYVAKRNVFSSEGMDIQAMEIYKAIFIEHRRPGDIAKNYDITPQRIRTLRDVFADQEEIPDGFADVC